MKKIFAFTLFLLTFNLFAGTALETNSVKEIEKTILEKGKKYGVKNVLVVFDIDNTLMAMPQNFGSDQWFGWQSENCMNKKAQTFCVANNFGSLLDVQGKIFAMSNMIPSEPKTPSIVKNLQKKGYKFILLTSRGYVYRNSTERALKMNKMNFIDSSIGPKKGYAGTYTPYKLKGFKKFGLSKMDMTKMGNKKPRPVSFMNGVFMTSGLNKGIMLKSLLAKTKSNFKAIIFADDHKKHTVRMQAILGNTKGLDLTTFRYGAIDKTVKAFHKSKKTKSIKAWKAMKALDGTVFK
jgi:hypothetical protein